MAVMEVASIARSNASLLRRWRISPTPFFMLLLAGGGLAGGALAFLPVQPIALACVASSVFVLVAVRPRFAAYLLLALTPLLAGLDRGAAIPFLRPAEALAVLIGSGLAARGILTALASGLPRFRPSSIDVAVFALAIASSILPFLWMLARGVEVTSDDVLYGLTLWKFAGIYLIYRTSIKTEREVRVCLWIVMFAGVIVSTIAMLQALGFGPVTAFVRAYFAPYGNAQTIVNNRGGSTFGLPIAAADFLTFDLAIAVGCSIHAGTFLGNSIARRILLLVFAGVFAAGVVASGEFSAVIGLVLAIVVLVIVTHRVRLFLYMVPALCVGLYILRPVIERRLAGFQSTTGLPVSWTGRLYNLRNYFWPELFSHDRFLLGVRLAARVVVPTQATGYVWIESGYTWLLWSGGVPFLLAFMWFAFVGIRRFVRVARTRTDAIGVAALASAVGMIVVSALMLFDPHLTYRGAADLLFALLALAAVGARRNIDAPDDIGPRVALGIGLDQGSKDPGHHPGPGFRRSYPRL
jgi:hypothetical protein